MAYKGKIIGGRKTQAKRAKLIPVPVELHALLWAYADTHNIYLSEATAHLIVMGLHREEGWDIEKSELATSYLPVPLPGRSQCDQRHTIREISMINRVLTLIEGGCPPEEITISARHHPNLAVWADEQGIGWDWKLKQDMRFPKEFGED